VRDRLRNLTTGVAIYGAGDAAISVVNFLLMPLYVRYLTPSDYGALLILISIETFAKLINRWGLDGAFMRYYLDRDEGLQRRTFTSTIVVFLVVLDGALLIGALAASRPLAQHLFDGGDQYLTALRLMLVNSFLMAFTFVPFHVMRLGGAARSYSAFTFARSAATTALRLVLIIQMGLGVTGTYAADLIVTMALLPLLWRWARPIVGVSFSRTELSTALRFSLPRLPSGLAQQAFDAGNKLLFNNYAPLGALGVYQNAFTLGTAVKFFLASFETAWAPFYYQTAKQPDAKIVLAKMTTYGALVLVLLCAGTASVARDLVLLMLNADYLGAIPIVPVIALGLAFQGVYLLTSIGLNLTSRTEYYPVTTFIAAGVGLGSGFVLMPRYGALGAAWAFLLSFATQALVGFVFARRFYVIPYEWARLARVAFAGVVSATVPLWVVPALPPLPGLLVRGTLTVAIFAALLAATGFFRHSEVAFLREMRVRLRRRRAAAAMAGDAD